MAEYTKPLPAITEENLPFWESAKAHELRLQRCTACGRFRYPIATFCPNCLGDGVEWTPVSGRGTVYSFIVMHQVYHPAFRGDVPYNVATVEFEEGPRTYTNIVGCSNDQVRVGMPVTIEYDDVTDDVTLVKFRAMEWTLRRDPSSGSRAHTRDRPAGERRRREAAGR